jgi:hypothetical protein
MPRPKRGEVWLVCFPFTDLTSTKLRPALVVVLSSERYPNEMVRYHGRSVAKASLRSGLCEEKEKGRQGGLSCTKDPLDDVER